MRGSGQSLVVSYRTILHCDVCLGVGRGLFLFVDYWLGGSVSA